MYSEYARMRTSPSPRPFGLSVIPARALALLGVSMLALTVQPVAAQSPQGGKVVKGTARISQSGARTTVRQSSERAVIDWRGFDVGRGNSVEFDQPGRTSATLNRVTSGRGSVIEGAIRAPGSVIIQNTAGVLFSKGSKVDVGGLVATSQGIDAGRFQRDGALRIGGGAKAGARVVNRGEITVGEAGLAALVGSDVENDGVILARRGTVALASGTRTTIDLTGDGMIRIAVDGDPAGGSRIANGGMIDAGGGRVLLSAGGASSALDTAINTTGVIRATSRSGDGGTVELVGRGQGKVRVSGTLDASGARNGGSVTVTGRTIAVANAAVSARGGADGGGIRLGGDRRGTGPLPRADHLAIAADVTVTADGGAGAGGRVIAWSEDTTRMDGSISATGATAGGFVETSGRFDLAIGPDATVSLGRGGAWLLDPRNVEIADSPATPPSESAGFLLVDASVVRATLQGGADVTVTTDRAGRDRGDIHVNADIEWTTDATFRLDADRDLTINRRITTRDGDFIGVAGDDIEVEAAIASTGAGNIRLESTGLDPVNTPEIRVAADIGATGAGDVSLVARRGNVILRGGDSGNLRLRTDTGDLTLDAGGGSVTIRRTTDKSGGNVQVYANSGDLALSASRGIDILGGDGPAGQWARVGRSNASADVTLDAPSIRVEGGSSENAFAEIVTGRDGAISMNARDILVQNRASEARVQAIAGSALAMNAETQTWNGEVAAGTGPLTGGDVHLSGAITATVEPRFSLSEDRSFTLAARTPAGAGSGYLSALPILVETSGSGTVDIDAPVAAARVTLLSEARVGLGPDVTVGGFGPGDAVVIAAGDEFDNRAGAFAIHTRSPGARWLVYINGFAGLNGPAPETRGYDLYDRFFPTNLPDSIAQPGNRVVYGEQPVLTITADTLSKTYGRIATPGYTLGALRPGDTAAIALDGTPSASSAGSPATADAGSYATLVSARASDQGYRLRLVPGVLTVNPAPLTVTANDATRTYGGADPAFTATYSGLVLGQGPDALTGALGFASTARPDSGVGAYNVTPGGQTSRNYAITYAPGAFDITPAPLIVTPAGTRTYGSPDTAYDPTFSGFVLGEGPGDLSGELVHRTDATLTSDAGTYGLTASGLGDPNYAITYADGALRIDPATLTVTADDAARTYGSANPAFTATYGGFVLGQTAADLGGALDFATGARPDSDVGAYRVTPGGQTSRNYVIAYAPGTLSVTRAPLTVTGNDATRTYGGADPAFTATYSGLVLGQTASDLGGAIGFTTTARPDSGVGRYAVTPGGQTSRNYAITYAPGAFDITPAALTVTPAGTRTYGSPDTVYAPSFSGFVLGEGPGDLAGTLTYGTDATLRSDAGTYRLTGSGLSDPNYAVTFADGALEIGRAALRIRADDATRAAGAANPAFTATYEGLVLGQTPDALDGDLAFRTPATDRSPAGLYAITPGGQTGRNYDIAWIDGTLAVRPAGPIPPRPQPPQPPQPPLPPQPPVPPAADGLTPLGDLTREFGRGVPPLTPGDASFRTTVAEAPPAIDSPFALTYSLGEIVQLAPPNAAGAGTGGFVPASGGIAGTEAGPAPGATCGGPVNTGADAGCARLTATENFWTSTAEGTP